MNIIRMLYLKALSLAIMFKTRYKQSSRRCTMFALQAKYNKNINEVSKKYCTWHKGMLELNKLCKYCINYANATYLRHNQKQQGQER